MPCASCGSNVVECDAASGTSFCAGCGLVFEESTIVSELTFGENSSGAAVLNGTMILQGQTHAPFRGAGGQGFNRPSKENTLYSAKLRIQAMTTALKLPTHYVDSAQRYYHLALNQGFTRGRKAPIVTASCLYIVCRMEKSPQMLIDFSDLLQTNVFKMGVTFIRLVRALNLIIPLIDPSLYIYRFSSMLDFEDKTQAVALDALRLVQRMDRDWIQTGRRPAGICGASLIIASRMHNFRRTEHDIMEVVKVTSVTLRKRLQEFKNTPTGQLSMANFRNIWLESAADPPAFTKSRFKSRRLANLNQNQSQNQNQTQTQNQQKKLSWQEMNLKSNENFDLENSDVVEYLVSNFKKHKKNTNSKLALIQEAEPELGIISEIYKGTVVEEIQSITSKKRAIEKKVFDGIKAELEPELEPESESEAGTEGEGEDKGASFPKSRSPVDKEIVFQVLQDERKKFMSLQAADSFDIDISKWTDIDDSEIENALLGPDEIKQKTETWTNANHDYLEKERFKELMKDDSKPHIKLKSNKKRKPRGVAKSGENALESTKNMLAHKKLSKKINYSILDTLFDLDKPRVQVEPGKITTIPQLTSKNNSGVSINLDGSVKSKISASSVSLVPNPNTNQNPNPTRLASTQRLQSISRISTYTETPESFKGAMSKKQKLEQDQIVADWKESNETTEENLILTATTIPAAASPLPSRKSSSNVSIVTSTEDIVEIETLNMPELDVGANSNATAIVEDDDDEDDEDMAEEDFTASARFALGYDDSPDYGDDYDEYE